MPGFSRPRPISRTRRRNMGGKVGSPATASTTSEVQSSSGCPLKPDGHDGRGQQGPDRHHRKRLEEDADHGQRGVDARPADQAGPQDDDHRLAGHVFSQVPDIERPQGRPEADVLPQGPQDAVPEDAAEQRPQQIQPAGGGKPRKIDVRRALLQFRPAADDRAADEP